MRVYKMNYKRLLILALALFLFLAFTAACVGNGAWVPPAAGAGQPNTASSLQETAVAIMPTPAPLSLPTVTPTPLVEAMPTGGPLAGAITATAAPVATQPFTVGNELTIAALRARTIEGSELVIEQTLANGANYAQYIASYLSEGYKIYGLLTVPLGDVPAGGFKAIIFNHGYIPPSVYRTTERYVAYVDSLARSGFVVFKIDLRGFGNSEGEPSGAYFSPDYTIDAISALKSLQTLDYVDPQGIGIWGHSMAGNLVLRAMLIEPDIQAGVIWAGAVYSYDDMVRYAIDDPSYRREEQPSAAQRAGPRLRETYGPPNTEVPFWRAVSLTENIEYLEAPLQLHHASNDGVVNIGYSQDLAAVLAAANKPYEFYLYEGGGHNIDSPYFSEAMQRTVAFFQTHL
jgi:alpha-beta hydrolase superfamily lysophospholipase